MNYRNGYVVVREEARREVVVVEAAVASWTLRGSSEVSAHASARYSLEASYYWSVSRAGSRVRVAESRSVRADEADDVVSSYLGESSVGHVSYSSGVLARVYAREDSRLVCE